MKAADLEQQLRRQPLRTIPAGWRAEILHATETVAANRPPLAAFFHEGWRETFWCCRRAWICLAAAWMVILAVNLATRETSKTSASQPAASALETRQALDERRWLMAELIGPLQTPDAEPPRVFVPRKRSEALAQTAPA